MLSPFWWDWEVKKKEEERDAMVRVVGAGALGIFSEFVIYFGLLYVIYHGQWIPGAALSYPYLLKRTGWDGEQSGLYCQKYILLVHAQE